MNWRNLLFRYTAKVADECGYSALADNLRNHADDGLAMDGGGIRILSPFGQPSRLLQEFPEEVERGANEIAFVFPIESVFEERIYRRPVLPEWAEE